MTHTTKHTPGPWGYNPISCDVEAIAISERIAMVETDVAWDEAKKSEIVHANGHLIAAAPAMYEALSHAAMSNHHPACKCKGEYSANPERYCTCHVQKAKAALAQAEGKL